MMDKYEKRRLALVALAARIGKGAQVKIADKIGVSASYVSRMLSAPAANGHKNIGEDTAETLGKNFPGWIASSSEANGLTEDERIILAALPLISQDMRESWIEAAKKKLSENEPIERRQQGNGGRQ